MIEILNEPKGNSYFQLIRYLFQESTHFSLVVRSNANKDEELSCLLDNLKLHLIKVEMVTEWPGTILLDSMANLYHFNCVKDAEDIISNSVDRLYSWILPSLPEDLTFYQDRDPLFVSISHEKKAYFTKELSNNKNMLDKIEVKWSNLKGASDTLN